LSEVSGLQIGASEVLNELPGGTLICSKRTRAEDGGNGLKVRVVWLINCANAAGSEASFASHEAVSSVRELLDEDGLKDSDGSDG